jgi:uncharacterized protein YndB with AHSA1/START domain
MSTDTAVRQAITVAVPAEEAFSTFTAGINRWWPRDHHIGRAELDEAIIEGHEGGRWYERDVDGSECNWGKVVVWDPPSRLVLAWQISGEWAYDADLWTEVEVTFVAVASMLTATTRKRCATCSTRPARGAGLSSGSRRRRWPDAYAARGRLPAAGYRRNSGPAASLAHIRASRYRSPAPRTSR